MKNYQLCRVPRSEGLNGHGRTQMKKKKKKKNTPIGAKAEAIEKILSEYHRSPCN
jgi:hypothetical protein